MQKTTLIEKHFELRFLVKLCLLVIAGMTGITLFLKYLTSRDLGPDYGPAFSAIYNLKQELFPLIFASFYSIFILAVVAAAIAVISMFYSHKIAGPMYRIERNLEAIGAGDLTVQTRFRGNDQLLRLAEEINDATRSLNHKVRNVADAFEEVKRAEKGLRALVDGKGAGAGELEAACTKLTGAIESLKKALEAVKVS